MLRCEKLPPIDTALEVYEYAVYFSIQSHVKEIKLFESVAGHTYIEKAKVHYPKYKENLKDIAAELEKKIVDTPACNFELKIYNTRNYATGAAQLSYQSHPDDKFGKLFGKLILVEFRKRGIMLSIRYNNSGSGNIQLTYQVDLHGHKTDDKMLNALN